MVGLFFNRFDTFRFYRVWISYCFKHMVFKKQAIFSSRPQVPQILAFRENLYYTQRASVLSVQSQTMKTVNVQTLSLPHSLSLGCGSQSRVCTFTTVEQSKSDWKMIYLYYSWHTMYTPTLTNTHINHQWSLLPIFSQSQTHRHTNTHTL